MAFIDIGHAKTTVTIAKYQCHNAAWIEGTVVLHCSDKNLGARNLDWKLMEQFAEEFEQENEVKVLSKLKLRLKMLESIEKMRKSLSNDIEASLTIESLINEIDLEQEVTRAQFNEAISPFTMKLKKLLSSVTKELEEKFEITTDQIEKVELLGDCSRTPVFQQVIREIFQMEKLDRSLHSKNTIAKGAAVLASIRSRLITPE